jgi:anti-sigma factor RsiW
MTCEYLDRDLDLYVDRELSGDADAAVRTHVSGCAVCRARVSERHALSRAVRSLPYYEAPPRVRSRISAGAWRWRSIRSLVAVAAAAVLLIAVGRGALLLSPDLGGGSAIEEVVDGHVRSLMADHLVDVRSTDQHTVKPWFTGKLDFSPAVVDLASIDFPLVGGRVDYLQGHAVAALVYQRRQHVINLFVAPSVAAAIRGPAARSIRGFHVRRWTSGGMSFMAVSDLNEAEMEQFVTALQSSVRGALRVAAQESPERS